MYIENFLATGRNVAGVGLWGASMLKTVVALVGFKAYLWALEELLGITIDIEIAALILLVLITIINILGVNRIKKIQTPIVGLMIAFIAILCIWSIFTLPMNWDAAFGEGPWTDGRMLPSLSIRLRSIRWSDKDSSSRRK